jgi:hypothetical protein
MLIFGCESEQKTIIVGVSSLKGGKGAMKIAIDGAG